jgi:hypothetical protein
MSFLAPLFLLGALTVALPVLFHLARRTTRERKMFSALMFLKPAPPRLTHRNRLEHLLLLALRCLAIGLLAAGFARPFLKKAVPVLNVGRVPTRTIILVDTSASMRRDGLWTEARRRAEAAIRDASPQDPLALFTFDRRLTPLVSFAEWNSTATAERAALAIRRLGDASPGWAATHLDHALTQAAELLLHEQEPKVDAQKVVLITDLQAGSRTAALQGYEWPKQVALVTERVASRAPGNASLHWLTDSTAGQSGGETNVRVRVSNEADSRQGQFQVGWADDAGNYVGTAQEIHLPAGQSRVATFPRDPPSTNATRIVLRGDTEPFDNTLFLAPPQAAHITVLYLGGDADSDTTKPLFFLRRALQQTGRLMIDVVSAKPGAAWPDAQVRAAGMLVLTEALPADQAQVLRDEVAKGKTLLFAPMNVAAAPTLARLAGLPEVRMQEAKPASYAMLGEMDFHHPLLALFADARFNNFTGIHVWNYRRIEAGDLPGARILARFDQGDPAWVELPVGKGRVLILTSGWHPADSQLALSTKFVPLLYSALELGGALSLAPVQGLVGDPVSLASLTLSTNDTVTVIRPDGSRATLAAGTQVLEDTSLPGVYRLTSGLQSALLALNLDRAESRTAPMAADEWARLGVAGTTASSKAVREGPRPETMKNAEIEQNQKLWRWFILATLGLLLVETWLAGRQTRHLTSATQATP